MPPRRQMPQPLRPDPGPGAGGHRAPGVPGPHAAAVAGLAHPRADRLLLQAVVDGSRAGHGPRRPGDVAHGAV